MAPHRQHAAPTMASSIVAALLLLAAAPLASRAAEMCGASPPAPEPETHDYSAVMAARRNTRISFDDLPGFTRSSYQRDHALITPESRVWAGHPGWNASLTAHLISPATAPGTNFAMYLATMQKGGAAAPPPSPTVERFVLVLDGEAAVIVAPPAGSSAAPSTLRLPANSYAYFPPGSGATHRLVAPASSASLLVYERVYSAAAGGAEFLYGDTEESPLLPVSGEVFRLRKLLPQTLQYDFNVHVMDFAPGEYLNVKEIHYNQHGLLLVEGKGVYRLGDSWYPVQAGDAIWMAPYVIQWYAALGTTPSRYILYKDTTVDPLFS